MPIPKKEEYGDWEPISGELVRFQNPGDSVEGTIVAITDGNYGKKNYDIKIADGTVKRVLGTEVIARLLANTKEGARVKIVFKGTVQSRRGFQVKDFNVFKAKGE